MSNAIAMLQTLLALVPMPDPLEPPGIGPLFTEWGGYIRWACGIGMVIGFLICAIQMMLGRAGRSQTAANGISGIPYVIGGGMLAASAALLATSIIGF